MDVRRKLILSATAGAAVLAALPLLAQQRPSSGPIARYDMRAGTITGMGAGGGMNPMAMMMGGGRGNNVQHELLLRLGSSNAPTGGGPKADHFMPPSARLGKSVELITPREERTPSDMPNEKPRGRMLIYWGCGEHAPAGQPVVIDFAKLAAGQVPPGLWTTTVIRDWGPTLQNSRTFGRWPAEDGKYAKPDTALPGAHRVVANYAPEIAFTLTRDFMPALSLRTSANPSGSTPINWTGIADATGYLATLFGGKQGPGGREMGDMVMWSSSASRQFGGGLADWLTPAQVAGLVRDRTVMAPSTTSCVIPAEVKRDAPDFRVGTLTAFGPMEEFSYPPRPADPRAPWNLQWTARIRHKSSNSWMDIPGMPAGMGMQDEDSQSTRDSQSARQQSQQQQCRPKRGLGGLLGGALGGMGGGGC